MLDFFLFLYAMVGSGVFIAENEKAKGVGFGAFTRISGSLLMAALWPVVVGMAIAGKPDEC